MKKRFILFLSLITNVGFCQQNEEIRVKVVFHIIHKSLTEKEIPNGVFETVLERVNNGFNNVKKDSIRSEFRDIIGSANIVFELAHHDINGNDINPITWHSTDVDEFFPYLDTVSSYGYRNSDYFLNIWLCSIYGPDGYTPSHFFDQFNLNTPNNLDGIIIDIREFIKNESYFLINHEIGHWFGLRHIWGRTNENSIFHHCWDDDGISDTPRQKGPNVNTRTPELSCDSQMISNHQNFMDYSNHIGMFTKEQVLSMREYIYQKRDKLIWSIDCKEASAGSNYTINKGESVQLQGSGGGSYSWSPNTGLNNPNIQNPIATPNITTTYTLTITNNQCIDTDQVTIFVTEVNHPTNDNCDDAIVVDSNTYCNSINGTIDYATEDGFPFQPKCDVQSNPNSYGVFYSFVAQSTTHHITVDPTGTLDAVVTLYTGESCRELAEIDCEDTQGGTGITTTLTNHNLIIGQRYWIRIYDYGVSEPPIGQGGFRLCVTHEENSGGNGVDLVSNIQSVSNTNPDEGDTIKIEYSVSNIGNEPHLYWLAPSIYLSTNQSLDDNYVYLVAPYHKHNNFIYKYFTSKKGDS